MKRKIKKSLKQLENPTVEFYDEFYSESNEKIESLKQLKLKILMDEKIYRKLVVVIKLKDIEIAEFLEYDALSQIDEKEKIEREFLEKLILSTLNKLDTYQKFINTYKPSFKNKEE